VKVGDNREQRSGVRVRSDRNVVLACIAAVAGMGALSYAAVPLYRMFCQVTGFGGTTQKAEKAPDVVLDRMVTVRFDANVTPGMAWEFEPEQRTMRVKVGENVLAFYKASNKSDKALTGEASFNVSPDIAGSYFAKIECFCFKEQTLAAGETVEMPVSFFVDPKIAEDRDADGVHEITLSYTFYPAKAPSSGSAAAVKAREAGQGS
jgi:cytochrome c oxidase assembly protein subunit 11